MNEEIKEQDLQVVRFQDLGVTLIEREGENWMTGEEVGRCLGYAEPRISINKLFERNRDEIEKYSCEVTLTSQGGQGRKTRIYNEQGAYKLSLFAQTEKAKDLRDWITTLPTVLKRIKNTGALPQEQILSTLNDLVAKQVGEIRKELAEMKLYLNAFVPRRAVVPEPIPIVDSVRQFIDRDAICSGQMYVLPPVLYTAYKSFCEEKNVKPVGKHRFYRAIRVAVHPRITKHRIGTKEYFRGIGLKNNIDDRMEVQ